MVYFYSGVDNEPGDNHAQGRWVTRMARLAIENQHADWLIHCDADEFWWPRHGSLKSVLKNVPPEVGSLKVRRSNFVPSKDEHGKFYRRMWFRELHSVNALGDRLPPKICHRRFTDVKVSEGNHRIMTSHPHQCVEATDIEIFHYPLRDYAQFQRKIKNGGAALERNKKISATTGNNWRYLYQELQHGRLRSYYDSQVPDEIATRTGLGANVKSGVQALNQAAT